MSEMPEGNGDNIMKNKTIDLTPAMTPEEIEFAKDLPEGGISTGQEPEHMRQETRDYRVDAWYEATGEWIEHPDGLCSLRTTLEKVNHLFSRHIRARAVDTKTGVTLLDMTP
jgi:hypothetical protein